MYPKNEAPTEPTFLRPVIGMEEIVSFSHKESLVCPEK